MAKGYKQLWADLEAREITQTAALVYFWLCGHKRPDNRIRVTSAVIGDAIGVERHTVGMCLRELIGRNYLTEKTYHGQHERVLIIGTDGTPEHQDHGSKTTKIMEYDMVHQNTNSPSGSLEAQAPQRSFESLYPLRGDVLGGAPLGSAPHQDQKKKESAKNFVGAFLGAMGVDDASK